MDSLNHHRSGGAARRGRRPWDTTDAALLALIRLVLDDAWSPEQAATHLRARVVDQAVLRRVRARVLNALAERPTPVAQRAARTLDALLDDPDPALAPAGR